MLGILGCVAIRRVGRASDSVGHPIKTVGFPPAWIRSPTELMPVRNFCYSCNLPTEPDHFKEVVMTSCPNSLAAPLCAAPLSDIDPAVLAVPPGAVDTHAQVVAASLDCLRVSIRLGAARLDEPLG